MRQRNIKNLEEKINAAKEYLVENPEDMKGKWRTLFETADGELALEIGCGKGQFIISHAKANPQNMYLAIEGQRNVLLRGLQKAKAEQLKNVMFFAKYIDDANDLFEKGEIDKIYLNFSDPWPKDRHARRRLTHRDRLKTYFDVLKEDGVIEFKQTMTRCLNFQWRKSESQAMKYWNTQRICTTRSTSRSIRLPNMKTGSVQAARILIMLNLKEILLRSNIWAVFFIAGD